MAETAVSLAVDQLVPLLREEANLLRGIHKEFADIKDELESIQAFLKDADKKAAAAEGDNTDERVKTWVNQVRQAAFRIEDIIDEYMIQVRQQPPHPGCVALFHKLKSMVSRHRIASEIQRIKSDVRGIKERSKRYDFQRSLEQGPSNSKWRDPRLDALYIEESEFVGYEEPRKRLMDWMVKGREERVVVSVVGMGGQGKSTLAKKVFDSNDVVRLFDCRVWITVSQSYNVEKLLRDMLIKFRKEKGDNAPRDISQMDRASLIDEVRNYLQQKRYVVVFDDVWDVHFWDDIKFAVIDNKNGSRIFITTRNLDVVKSCKKSSLVELLELEPLTQEQSLELFNKKAFQFDYGGCCPKELIGIANEIVQKCKGLPLAIGAIGGLLYARDKNVSEWKRFSENLSFELKKDTDLIRIKEMLGLSYDDLPYYLKPCLLYFSIYPEDYVVRSKRVIRQWIAEGFVKEERGKTLEEVAEGYLIELIHRSLVQVSSLRIDGKAKRCRVHDLIRDMILEKNEDLNFCEHISYDGLSNLSGIVRRLSVTTELRTSLDDLNLHIERSHVRSLFALENSPFSINFCIIPIPTKFRLLKVLDYDYLQETSLPRKVGSLIHLKYLSFNCYENVKLPKSIGMLQNLETLEVRNADTLQLPKEISKLRKLRHLIATNLSLTELKNGIREMTSLQTLRNVDLDMNGATEVIKELGKLKQIRDLGLINVHLEDGSIISSSINEMRHLEKLIVQVIYLDKSIDLDLISAPTMLWKLSLLGRLNKLPEWILELQNLLVLRLEFSYLTKDPMQSLKSLQHLLIISLTNHAYEGLCLHFEDGGFQKLKELYVEFSSELRDIINDKGALSSLKKLQLGFLFNLKKLPKGILHLEKLQVLDIRDTDFENLNWMTEHMPTVKITHDDNNVE